MKIRFLIITILFINSISIKAQSLFDINTIRTVEINFYASNWDYILDSLATLNTGTGSGTQRILADVIIDGIQFDSCGVRYKGNSSMDTASFKNPFNIDLNHTISGQDYMGKDKIKLANCFTDPSMVREALSYEIANNYMDAPHGSFVKLFVNSDYRGIYTNTESVDNEFLDEYYGSSNNPFFKCDPVSFELYGDNSNLAYHADTMVYDTLYDMKSDYGLTELQNLCLNLEFNITNIEQFLDVDRALWFLALSSILVHNDGYTAFGHNYYVYKMDNGRWSIVLWDVNMSFGGLLWNGTNLLPLPLADLQNQDPYLHETAYNFRPLIARLLSVPKYKKMYTAHYKTIQEEHISNQLYLQRAQAMQDLIETDVQNEQYNPYTFAQFISNLYSNVGFWFDLRPGLETLMSARDTYLNTIQEFQEIAPTISNINVLNSNPQPFSTITVNATIINETDVEIGYRHHIYDQFIKTPMYDDGLHNDGAANDNIYGADINLFASEMQYYIYAENLTAAKFSPVRAQYEFYSLTPETGLVINEFSADNESIIADQDGEFDDWIEIYNNSSSSINLADYYLSDDQNNLQKWIFPAISIAANNYLIIWADKDTLQIGLHANFKLSSNGESLFLSQGNNNIIDQIAFPNQSADITYGRYINGLGNFQFLYPSFNAENLDILSTEPEISNEISLKIFPNPTSDYITIEKENETIEKMYLYNFNGKLIKEMNKLPHQNLNIDVSYLPNGTYILNTEYNQMTKFIKF